VNIGGVEFPIRHDFRDGIRFESLIYDCRVPEGALLPLALTIWFEAEPDADKGEVIAAMLDFYRCGKPVPPESGEDQRLFSYDHDYDLIYAGFLTSYNIDVLDPETKLHWWKFRAMLAALPESSQLMRVISYRAAKVESWMSRAQKASIRKMRRLHALPGAEGPARRIRDEASYHEALEAMLAEEEPA